MPITGADASAKQKHIPRQIAQIQEGGKIEAVRVDGTQRIDPDTVRSYLTVQPGDEFSAEGMDKSLKALFNTGLFADVHLERDGNTLVVHVVENPIINRIAFEGNHRYDDPDLLKEIQLRPRTVYTRTRVQADVKRILDLYRRAGRFAATVDPKIIKLSENRVNLVFEIHEGAITKIESINFIGNTHFSNSDLTTVISTKESRWWRLLSNSDNYDPDRQAYDQELLRKFYLSQGYADFRVISAVSELAPDQKGFLVTYTVSEGERYKFGHVALTVALKNVSAASLRPLLSMHDGDWYNADQVDGTVDSLTKALGDRGYAFLDIQPIVNQDKAKHTIDVTFRVGEGPRVYVERIDISGNVRTLDRVIRREFELAEGDAFSTSKLKRTQQNLENLGYFKKVTVTNVPGSTPDKTIIKVNVDEQSTGEFTVGTGFSTAEGILGNVSVHEANLLGKGQDARISATIAQYERAVDLSFTEPYFMGRPIATGFDLFDSESSFETISNYSFSSLGATGRAGFQISDNLRSTYSYTIRNDNITNISTAASPYIKSAAGARVASIVGQVLLYDRRDNRLNPTSGYYLQSDSSIAGLGGDVSFGREVVTAGYYYPIAPKWVLGVKGEVGYIHGIGKAVNIQDRFFVGGDNLRGFADAGVGPHDQVTGDALGAQQYYTGSVQLGVPLGLPQELGVSGHVFSDFGSAWRDDDTAVASNPILDSKTIRVSAGFGVTWKSPLGPIQLDFGIPVKKAPGDQTEIFRVNFGTGF
ncbi:MAG TPA: outer membrane protein assembly factor BamA [Stellaceae bacterium]|nr:outer membrane protein assembly factor BamA [Stellaceae bacterium]